MPFPKLLLQVLLAVALSGTSFAQGSALTVARSLDQLTNEAALIIHGSVVSAKIEPHPTLRNLTTALVTVSVSETLKGAPKKTLVFRQYLWDLRAQLGAPEYRKGQELILLLGPVSEYGLTSPVGLEQGKFRVFRDAKGKVVAANGRENAGLFGSMQHGAAARGMKLSPRVATLAQPGRHGPVPLADLEEAIRGFAGAK